MPFAAALPAIATVGSAIIGSNAANKASKAYQNATNANLDFMKQQYADAKGILNPFITQGTGANNQLSAMLGVGGDKQAATNAFNNFLNNTNYQFQLDQGLKGVNTAYAPALNSGATIKALNDYAQGMAGNALSGYMGQLQNQAGMGLSAGNALAGFGAQYSQQNQNINNNNANAQANIGIGKGNLLSNALSQLSGQIGANPNMFNGVTSALSSFGTPSSFGAG